jgi:hypothetical protein
VTREISVIQSAEAANAAFEGGQSKRNGGESTLRRRSLKLDSFSERACATWEKWRCDAGAAHSSRRLLSFGKKCGCRIKPFGLLLQSQTRRLHTRESIRAMNHSSPQPVRQTRSKKVSKWAEHLHAKPLAHLLWLRGMVTRVTAPQELQQILMDWEAEQTRKRAQKKNGFVRRMRNSSDKKRMRELTLHLKNLSNSADSVE